ncbi:MAG: hypothetical protein RBS72_02955, partial [Sedimentisphaerales bacterium]|nr:hypothetical protein [Sedimentisphaerales bacterium]
CTVLHRYVLSLSEWFLFDLSTIDQRKDSIHVPVQCAKDILRHQVMQPAARLAANPTPVSAMFSRFIHSLANG